MKRTLIPMILLLFFALTLWGQTSKVRLLEGESYVHRPTDAKDKRMVQIRNRGRALLDGTEFEVEFKVDIRGAMQSLLSSLLESGKIAGLRGACTIYVDGMPKGSINMSQGRMDSNIWAGLIGNALDEASQGKPDPPDIEFTQESDVAEWSRIIVYDDVRYKVLIRFVYRDSSRIMRHYVFVEKVG